MKPKLSEIIKEMAQRVLKNPSPIPSSEAAHAALLMAHVAWNRTIGGGPEQAAYPQVLREFDASSRWLWGELTSEDAEVLIAELVAYKVANHADDRRRIVVCGMRGDNVHVEWTDAMPNTG